MEWGIGVRTAECIFVSAPSVIMGSNSGQKCGLRIVNKTLTLRIFVWFFFLYKINFHNKIYAIEQLQILATG